MADIDYDDYGAPPRMSGGQAQKLIHLTGAVCSLALIAGLGLWGYRLAERDASGVPVIRAAEGPMRVAPSNPGGNVADHQGMAVNVVAAVGGAGGMPEAITLAPAPVDLAAEDSAGLMAVDPASGTAADVPAGPPAAGAALAEASVAAALAVAALEPSGLLPISPEQVPGPEAPAVTQDPVAMALAEALGDALPLAPLAELPETAQPDPESESLAGVAGSVRPMARPQAGLATPVATEAASEAIAAGPELDPSTLTAGTRLVQLGAFDSPELARSEWVKLRARFGDLMTGKSLVVQSAQSGGRTFYRLRAHGFAGEDDSRRFCAALLAEDAACIPVQHR